MTGAISRRDVLGALLAGATVLQLPAAEPGAPLFFTPAEFKLLDCLTELIIPTDDHSPGAHDAGVAVFIDRKTAEAFAAEDKNSWRDGLKAVQAVSGGDFTSMPKPRQIATLQQFSQSNQPFFKQLKETTAFAYYSSKIGIHQDMQYKGNVLIVQFVGYDVRDERHS